MERTRHFLSLLKQVALPAQYRHGSNVARRLWVSEYQPDGRKLSNLSLHRQLNLGSAKMEAASEASSAAIASRKPARQSTMAELPYEHPGIDREDTKPENGHRRGSALLKEKENRFPYPSAQTPVGMTAGADIDEAAHQSMEKVLRETAASAEIVRCAYFRDFARKF
jgi:hypothetical protein